ncbi:MAG: hypothetical protein ACP5H5_10645, partial [Pyrobaculum sp.]
WPLYGPDGSPYPLEKLEGVVNKAVAKAFTRNVLGGEVDGWSVAYLIARGVYGEPSYDDLRRLGAGLGINHEEFIKTYCGKERESRGERIYPVLPLTGISGVRPGRLVDALAAAVGAVKISVDAAAERLKAAGDPRLRPVAEVLSRWDSQARGEREGAWQAKAAFLIV